MRCQNPKASCEKVGTGFRDNDALSKSKSIVRKSGHRFFATIDALSKSKSIVRKSGHRFFATNDALSKNLRDRVALANMAEASFAHIRHHRICRRQR